MPDARKAGGAGLNATNTAPQPWNCAVQGHLYVVGQDACIHCGYRLRVVTAAGSGGLVTYAPGTATRFPDVDAVLDSMAALQHAQDMLAEGMGPPDEIRALAHQRAEQLGMQVVFSRALEADELRWRVMVRTRRGEVTATPKLTQEQMVTMAIDSDEWQIESWKNALREVGLL